MKKLLLFIITALLNMFVIAQTTQFNPFDNFSPDKITINYLKSTTDYTIRLDSVVVNDSTTVKYDYSSNGYKFYSYTNGIQTEELDYSFTGDTLFFSFYFISNGYARGKSVYYINANEIIDSIYGYTYDTTNQIYKNSIKQCYYHNSLEQDTAYIYSYFQDDKWYPSSKNKYNYDDEGNMTTDIEYDYSNLNWQPSNKEEYSYDENNNDTCNITYSWSNSAWQLSSKYVYSYDENNNLIANLHYYWSASIWNPSTKYECTFNTNYTNDEILLPRINLASTTITVYNYNNMLESFVSYSYSNSSWNVKEKDIYYYSSLTETSISSSEKENSLSAYITNNQLQINNITAGETISVYNINGSVVYRQKASENSATIQLPANGFYIVSNGKKSIKVVKE